MLLKYERDAIVNVFTELCQLSWSKKEAKTMDRVLNSTNSKKKAISKSMRIIELLS